MSDLNKFWILSCVCFAVIKTVHSIDVEHLEQTWYESSKKCGEDGLEFRENILKNFEVLQTKAFWIGEAIYKKTSEWIEILGCYAFTKSHGMTKLTKISSVVECQIKCKSHIYFGYNELTDICICSENKPTNNTNITVCESTKTIEAYFFYRVYPETVQLINGGHCSTLDCRSKRNNLKAINCLTRKAVVCGNGERLYWKTFYESLNWCKSKNQLLLEPSTHCKMDENADQGIEFWTNVFRNVSECQLTITEADGQAPTHCLAGELVRLDGQLKLKKTKRDCRNRLDWFLCRNKTVETQSLTAASTRYVPFKPIIKTSTATTSDPVFTTSVQLTKRKTSPFSETKLTKDTDTEKLTSLSQRTSTYTVKSSFTKELVFSTNAQLTKRKTSPFSVTLSKDTDTGTLTSLSQRTSTYTVKSSFTKERMSYIIYSTESPGLKHNIRDNSHQMDDNEEGSNSKTLGAIIGGLLGACIVIAVLVVLIVCKVRAIGFFRESSTHDQQEPSQMEFSKATYQDSNITTDNRSTKPTSNETYGLVENSTAVYAVVNKIKTPGNTDYTDAGEGEYDHLHDLQNRRIIPQENLYHSHGSPQNKEDQTYDSSHFNKGKYNDGNSLYDQSCSLVEEEYSYSTSKNPDNSNTLGIYDKIS